MSRFTVSAEIIVQTSVTSPDSCIRLRMLMSHYTGTIYEIKKTLEMLVKIERGGLV